MSEHAKTPRTDEIESAPLADADLENVSGGGTSGSTVVRKDGAGYSKGKLS